MYLGYLLLAPLPRAAASGVLLSVQVVYITSAVPEPYCTGASEVRAASVKVPAARPSGGERSEVSLRST